MSGGASTSGGTQSKGGATTSGGAPSGSGGGGAVNCEDLKALMEGALDQARICFLPGTDCDVIYNECGCYWGGVGLVGTATALYEQYKASYIENCHPQCSSPCGSPKEPPRCSQSERCS